MSLNFNNRSGVMGADGVRSSTADRTTEKIAWIREAAGGRFDRIELEIGAYFTFVTDQPQPIIEGMASGLGFSAEEMRTHPHGLFGSIGEICEELERRREAHGISYVTVTDEVADAFAPVVARLAGR